MKPRTPILVNILTIVTILFIAFYTFIPDWSFLTSFNFWGTVVLSIILAFIAESIGDLIENQKFKALTPEEQQKYLALKKVPFLKRLKDGAFSKQNEKEEKDLIIDHGFDGIMELDNQLPKWWLGLFYFGVVFCVVYVTSFFISDFAHPVKEYDKEYKEQLAAIEIYTKTAPQITLETAKYNPENIPEGQELFKNNCATCHGDEGKGGIGPNLTDDYWINQPEKDVFHNVFKMDQDGSPTNPSMRGFIKSGELTGKDVEKIAAYVYHINQEIPPITVAQGGAAPQGTVAPWVKGTPRK